MLTRQFSSDLLYRDGYTVFSLSDRQSFENLCCEVRKVFTEVGAIDSAGRQDHRLFFEELHCASPFDGVDINDIRVRVISALASEKHHNSLKKKEHPQYSLRVQKLQFPSQSDGHR